VASDSLPFHFSSQLPQSLTLLQSHKFDGSHWESLSLTFLISSRFSGSVFAQDSAHFFESFKLNPSFPIFVNVLDDSTSEHRVGLIVGIVCSLVIGIVCLIMFFVVKRIHKESDKSGDIFHQNFTLDDDNDDHPSVVTVTGTCILSDESLPTRVLSVTHPSDCFDQSILD
jgi:hypothetical protein